jgi:copper chaperone CopZ
MKKFSFDVPTMYGDHHVQEVRRILFEIPGVEDVYASSGFHVIEVSVDENIVTKKELETALEKAGYLGELELAVEVGTAGLEENDEKPFFRHSTAQAQTGQVVSFAQSVPYTGRPLWPCPGMGPLPSNDEKEN